MSLASLSPNFPDMWELFWTHKEYYLSNLGATYLVSLTGVATALVISLFCAICSVKISLFEKLMNPLVLLSQSFPLQAITPIILIAIGVSFYSKVLISFIIAFFPMYGECQTAIKTTPSKYLNLSKVYKFNFFAENFHIRIPFALPSIVSATRTGFTLAVLGAVIAEFMQQDSGIGRLILSAQGQYNISSLYICLLLLILPGGITYQSLSIMQRIIIDKRGPSHE